MLSTLLYFCQLIHSGVSTYSMYLGSNIYSHIFAIIGFLMCYTDIVYNLVSEDYSDFSSFLLDLGIATPDPSGYKFQWLSFPALSLSVYISE